MYRFFSSSYSYRCCALSVLFFPFSWKLRHYFQFSLLIFRSIQKLASYLRIYEEHHASLVKSIAIISHDHVQHVRSPEPSHDPVHCRSALPWHSKWYHLPRARPDTGPVRICCAWPRPSNPCNIAVIFGTSAAKNLILASASSGFTSPVGWTWTHSKSMLLAPMAWEDW